MNFKALTDTLAHPVAHAAPVEDPAAAAPAVAPAVAPKARRGRPPGVSQRSASTGAGGLRGQCWWLMRQQTRFTINQLLDTYASGEEKDAHNNLAHYLGHLERCGVVQRLPERCPGEALTSPGRVVWCLVRDLGVLAPVWRHAQRALWDANTATLVPETAVPAPVAANPDSPEADTHA